MPLTGTLWRPRVSGRTAVALILLAIGAAIGCATPGRPISEEERCARFGGTWLAGSCHPLDDGK